MVEALEVAFEFSSVFEVYLALASGMVANEIGRELEFIHEINVQSFSLFLVLFKLAFILIVPCC